MGNKRAFLTDTPVNLVFDVRVHPVCLGTQEVNQFSINANYRHGNTFRKKRQGEQSSLPCPIPGARGACDDVTGSVMG